MAVVTYVQLFAAFISFSAAEVFQGVAVHCEESATVDCGHTAITSVEYSLNAPQFSLGLVAAISLLSCIQQCKFSLQCKTIDYKEGSCRFFSVHDIASYMVADHASMIVQLMKVECRCPDAHHDPPVVTPAGPLEYCESSGTTEELTCTPHTNDLDTAIGYAWKKDENTIPGPISTLAVLKETSANGEYQCTTTTANTGTQEAVVPVTWRVLTISPPTLSSSVFEVEQGSSFTLTCAAASSGTPTYSWFKGDTVVSGETSITLHISSATTTDAGDYICKTTLTCASDTAQTTTESTTAIIAVLSPACTPDAPYINEFHYDNTGDDIDEFVEIAGAAGTDFTNWRLLFYNGNGGYQYDSKALTGVLTDSGDGVGFMQIPHSLIQNGSPDGIALVNEDDIMVQFLSYGGEFQAISGLVNGVTSVDISVTEPSDTPVGNSLQLTGTGCNYADFTWAAPADATPGDVNNGQSFV